jgi:hypothetical protein
MADRIPTPRDITIEVNGAKMTMSFSDAFGQRLNEAPEKGQAMFDEEVARMTDKYVPFQTGMLANSVITASQIGKGELVYNTPYARSRYFLHASGSDLRDGVRGSYWGHRSVADNKTHFADFARKAVGGLIEG